MDFLKYLLFTTLLAAPIACASAEKNAEEAPKDAHTEEYTSTVQTETNDGVVIYGELYYGDLTKDAPLILLFHQGGSNGRAEYAGLAKWLNEHGYRAIAWDQRLGGDLYGGENRTQSGLSEDADFGFCDAAPDLQAALDYTANTGIAEKVFLWGSSYSASLVFKLAAENPNNVQGVLAFSPASGGPMADCHAGLWSSSVNAPILALRPLSEMQSDASKAQRDTLIADGADFYITETGIHGSSMLVDARTNSDMSEARAYVLNWLDRAADR